MDRALYGLFGYLGQNFGLQPPNPNNQGNVGNNQENRNNGPGNRHVDHNNGAENHRNGDGNYRMRDENRGGNHRNRGGNNGNRGDNQGNRGGHHGNRGGNPGNRGNNHGNRGGGHGNRGGNHGNRDRDANQGGNLNHGHRRENRGLIPERNRNPNEQRDNRNRYRGAHNNRRDVTLPPQMPQMDWFNMRQNRDQSEDRRSVHSNINLPVRRQYGGHYGSSSSLNLQDDSRYNRNREQDRSRQERPRGSGMGFKKLEELSNLEPDKLVLTLSNQNSGLEKLFQSDLSPDYIVLILRVLNQLCGSTFQANKASVLTNVCQKDFMDQLNLYLSDIVVHDATDKRKNKFFWDEQERFWNDLLNLYENILNIIPNTGCEILPKFIKKTCISVTNMEREQGITISDEIKEKLEDLQIKIMMSVEEREKKKQVKSSSQDELEPPDDFRQISLYPTVSEITRREQAFVRQNVIAGRYRSVEHYLDVQFRLLREDFVAPLRAGICDYLQQMESRNHKRIFNVRIYRDVKFVRKLTIQDKVALVVQLNIQKKKMKVENSRRFMFGSLVCFTRDNFLSVIFGTVAGRDAKLLENGQITVDILDSVVTDDKYIMVECSVFFEPYYHVLKALQMMTEDKFPLKRYIIDVEPDVNPPSYYTYLSSIHHLHYEFNPLVPNSWPSAEQLVLDPSQYRAFQAAISKEFCVIQGPPGTGKTFIGLKMAQVFLENKQCWNNINNNKCPILVICFTNHALDQFLEGILKYTTKLVRIGGQSKNEKLKGYNIRDMRSRAVRTRDSAQLMNKKRVELREYMNKIHSHQTFVDAITNCDRVINFKNFEAIDDRIKNSWFSRVQTSDIINWLLGGRNPEERYQERVRIRRAQFQAQLEQEAGENDDSDSDDDFFDAEAQEEREVDDRDDIVIKTENINVNTFTLLTLRSYEDKIINLEKELATLEAKAEEENALAVYDEKAVKENELFKAREDLEYLQWRFDQFRTNNLPNRPLIIDYNKPDMLTPNERWGLYFYWVRLFYAQLNEDLTILDINYRQVYRQYEEVRQIEDTQIMREMLVVGMTTSGAARYQSLLQALKCPIVIVEEAAEVLESHVIVSLTNDCRHLILIGDHQQLRPTTAEFRLAKDYKLDISLFERMVNNKIHCEQLEVQHRMRPEIARLIVPSIYPKLDNHYTVESFPPILGITKNLFFINHQEPEESVGDTGSRRNVHEAKFLIRLARHFILQGYEPHEITILATYSGQMFCLWKERKEYPILKDVRITVVDNFQGEENKIILLSLVRSNAEDNVGFLKTDNRVCVALSRAKEGMYIMGNMNILEKSSDVWRQIKRVLESNDQFGTHLTLQCQVHFDQLTRVSTAVDFNKVTEGGCTQLCNKQLDCGHVCSSLCHITDREHVNYKCKKPCNKILCELDHVCPDLCFETCKPCRVPLMVVLKCGHTHNLPCHMHDTSEYACPTIVDVTLECGHSAKKPCHRDIKTYPCPHPCEIRLLCGHACTRKCHINDDADHLQTICRKPCERIKVDCSTGDHKCLLACYQDCQLCETNVEKKRSCNHMYVVPCNSNVEELICLKPCKKKLECGHACKQKCSEPCGNCNVMVKKIVPECNHTVKIKCKDTAVREKCRDKCTRFLNCGHPCDKRCNELCQTKCTFLVNYPYDAACGHKFKVPCYVTNAKLDSSSYELLQYCTEPCGAELLCSHRCTGTCGTCAQGRVHATCQEQCGRTLVCNHACEIPCRDMCQPCTKRCSYRCKHSKCGKKCGEPCMPCKEFCTRRCDHQQCNKKCGEKCSVPPCNEPCRKKLKCGHNCIGFCGDPCPPVCRICDPENDAFTIMFGNEDDPEARFVYLEECKHVIESDAMDTWLNQTLEGSIKEINVKHCPKCKTTLAFTERYSEFIKEAYADINKVKEKWFGQEQHNEQSRIQLQIRISEVKNIDRNLYLKSKHLNLRLHELQKELKEVHKGKRNPLNIISIISCTSQIGLIETLVNIFAKGDLASNENLFGNCLQRFNYLLMLMHNKNGHISKQRATDIELEINRFERFIQLCTIEKNPQFQVAFTNTNFKVQYMQIYNVLNSIERYSEIKDKELKSLLKKLAESIDKSMVITDKERKSILKAMEESKEGLGKGRWFKCPNGHYFAIGECGGAMQVGRCNECGAKIGGQNHALLETNQFAGEMDGAAHPAWSNAANLDMRNFLFD